MVMTNGTDGNRRELGSLGELPRNVAPPRDLWPSIAAQIATEGSAAPVTTERSRFRPTGMQWAALAAVVSALAVGVWLGRTVLPAGGAKAPAVVASNGTQARDPLNGTASGSNGSNGSNGVNDSNGVTSGSNGVSGTNGTTANNVAANGADDPNSLSASFVTDPRYTMQRASLIRGLEAQLQTLPPDTQHKVASSLKTIRTSIQDLQEAIGRDPANALLQELLVNSYQDEMRVLTAVHEAGGVNGGI
jgi:hypothetical protein